MRKLVPIKDHPDLMKDISTGMIVNINSSKAIQAKQARLKKLQEREEIENLKSDVSEIKMMLKQLLENKPNA